MNSGDMQYILVNRIHILKMVDCFTESLRGSDSKNSIARSGLKPGGRRTTGNDCIGMDLRTEDEKPIVMLSIDGKYLEMKNSVFYVSFSPMERDDDPV